jgi:hypothetical protein
VKADDNRLYYSLLSLSTPDLWDEVVGGYVSFELTQDEQDYIVLKRIGKDKLIAFIDEARGFFDNIPTVYYKRTRWTSAPIQGRNVEDALSTVGWQYNKEHGK